MPYYGIVFGNVFYFSQQECFLRLFEFCNEHISEMRSLLFFLSRSLALMLFVVIFLMHDFQSICAMEHEPWLQSFHIRTFSAAARWINKRVRKCNRYTQAHRLFCLFIPSNVVVDSTESNRTKSNQTGA